MTFSIGLRPLLGSRERSWGMETEWQETRDEKDYGKKPGMKNTIQEISAVECCDDYYDDVTTLTLEND